MGGFGSGRRSGSGRNTLEACLAPGSWGGWQWTLDGDKVAQIGLRSEEEERRRMRSGATPREQNQASPWR